MNSRQQIELVKGVFIAGKLHRGVFEDQLVTLISDRVKATFSDLPAMQRDLSFLILIARCVKASASKNPLDEKSACIKILVTCFPSMTEDDIAAAGSAYDAIVEHGLIKEIPRLTKLWYWLFHCQKKSSVAGP